MRIFDMHLWRAATARSLLILSILSITGVAHAQGRAEAAEQAARRLTEVFQKEATAARRLEFQRADAASAKRRVDEYRHSFNSAADNTQTSGGRWSNPGNNNAMLVAQRAEADRAARAAAAEANARAVREQKAAAAEQARVAQLAESRRATEAHNAAIRRQQEVLAAQKRADDATQARRQQMEAERLAKENTQRAQQAQAKHAAELAAAAQKRQQLKQVFGKARLDAQVAVTNGHGKVLSFAPAFDRSVRPLNNGFAGAPRTLTIPRGKVIDRLGDPGGRFVAPEGTPDAARAIARTHNPPAYRAYRVIEPIPNVEVGRAAQAHGQTGGGTQMQLPQTVESLQKQGKLQRTYSPEFKRASGDKQ
jgi:chemotaxis protein histidine kinase CheA